MQVALPFRFWARDLLRFWLRELRPSDWFNSSDEVDRALRARFGRTLGMMAHRPTSEFLSDPATARAAILLFDQVPRNVFRDDPRAFATDRKAVALTRAFLSHGWHRGLDANAKQFVAMPLMHSERIADQRLGLAFFARERLYDTLRFARAHHRMIARFGRFPHRNAVLGRETSAKEQRAIDAGFAW